MKTNNKGFDIVEFMIIVVIVGLLVAMAIPAFQKVKYNLIKASVESGQKVSKEDYEYYRKYKIKDKPTPVNSESVSVESSEDSITVDGKTYYYLDGAKEIIINDQAFYLIEKKK